MRNIIVEGNRWDRREVRRQTVKAEDNHGNEESQPHYLVPKKRLPFHLVVHDRQRQAGQRERKALLLHPPAPQYRPQAKKDTGDTGDQHKPGCEGRNPDTKGKRFSGPQPLVILLDGGRHIDCRRRGKGNRPGGQMDGQVAAQSIALGCIVGQIRKGWNDLLDNATGRDNDPDQHHDIDHQQVRTA